MDVMRKMSKSKISSSSINDEEEEVMLPGFRFHPTDEELVGFYLRRKVEHKPLPIEVIKHADIYKYDPWDLPKVSSINGDHKEWYFFCIRGRKYRNSIRPNRVTGSGFWKATGIDKPIFHDEYSKEPQPHHEYCIGLKKSLVYYRGSAGKGTKTDWMMHEFRLPPNAAKPKITNPNKDLLIAQEAEVWTLCRIFKRTSNYKKYTPNWKETKLQKPINNESSSKTCSSSLESETSACEQQHQQQQYNNYIHQQNETKPFIINDDVVQEINQQASSPYSSAAAAAAAFYYNPNGDDFFTNGNWDELRSVVDLANIDPSHHVN